MFKFAINHGIIVTVAVLIICTLGIAAIFRVPVQMIPDMDVTTLSVVTRWPGATPQDVEKEIIIEQEKYLRSLPYLEKMTSEATTGRASIELEFQLGSDINEVLIYTNNALSQVPSYPENVDQPRVLTSVFSSNSFMYFSISALEGNPKNLDIIMQRDFIEDTVQTALERVPGVSEVNVRGGAERQIKIYLDPMKLAERQISLSALRQALRQRNTDVSGGDINSGKRRYLLRTVGRFSSIEEIEQTIIAHREGNPIYLHELGHVEFGHAEIQSIAHINGEQVISLSIKRQLGSNVINVMDGVMAVVAELNEHVLQERGLRMQLNNEDVQYIRDAVQIVGQNLFLGACLATLILLLFLRSPATTLIGALGIPICTIAAFLGLLVMGRTINVISLAGIAFAIGMTLDNSIVVLENIDRHRKMGKKAIQAAYDGVEEVWTAVLASTLTTIFVFLPIIFIEQEAGQLYSDIAIAIASAILMSMLVAITIVPAATAQLKVRTQAQPQVSSLLVRLGNQIKQKVMAFISWLLPSVVRRLVLIGSVLILAFGIIWGLTPKAEYLPEGEEAKVFAFMFPPSGYNLPEMARISAAMNEYFVPHIQADRSAFIEGKTPVPPLDVLVTSASDSRLMLIATTRHEDMAALIDSVTEKFREIPGMRAFASRGSIFSGNLGGTRSVELDITGPELAPLYEVALKTFLKAKELFNDPQIRPVPGLSLGQPLLEIRPDWNRAQELGIHTADLGYLIWALADGAYVDEFFLADDKIDMFLYSTANTVQKPQDLAKLPIYSQTTGHVVPLSAIADIVTTVNTETIRRVDGERTVTLAIVAPRETPLETAVERVKTEIIAGLRASGDIPDNVSLRIAGASDKLQATRAALSGNFVLAILISYFLMVAIFSHWGYPFIIMLSVPLGIGGGIVGLWLINHVVNQPFDMITMLGFLVLIGTVVNNPILLVEQALHNRAQGMEIIPAVIHSTEVRLRPILMSTITTLFGLSPLVFLPGAGSELYRGLGTIVLFGLLFSTLITLTFMPSLLSLLLQLGERFGRQPVTEE